MNGGWILYRLTKDGGEARCAAPASRVVLSGADESTAIIGDSLEPGVGESCVFVTFAAWTDTPRAVAEWLGPGDGSALRGTSCLLFGEMP